MQRRIGRYFEAFKAALMASRSLASESGPAPTKTLRTTPSFPMTNVVGMPSIKYFSDALRPGSSSTGSVRFLDAMNPVPYTHLRAHETPEHLVCRLLLE